MKIFDFHTHPGYDWNEKETGIKMTPEVFIGGLKSNGITRASGTVLKKYFHEKNFDDLGETIKELNSEAYSIYKAYPDFYSPGIHVNPDLKELSLNEIEKYGKLGVKLIGEIVRYNWTTEYNNYDFFDILHASTKYDMVLNFHPTNYNDVKELVLNNKQTKIVMAHVESSPFYEEVTNLAKQCDNLYFDISGKGIFNNLVKNTVNKVGKERVLFGSDYPGYDVKIFVDKVLNSGLLDSELECVLWSNAVNLLDK